MELDRVDEIVLDRVPRAHDLRLLEAGDGAEHLHLDVVGQARRDPVGVIFGGVAAPRARGRPGASPSPGSGRPCPRSTGSTAGRSPDDAGVQGRPGQAGTDRLVRRLVGVRQPARELRTAYLLGIKGERHGAVVPVLAGRLREIDGLPVEPGGGAGLEPPHREAQPPQGVRKAHRREIARPPRRIAHQPDVDQPFQEGPRGQDRPSSPGTGRRCRYRRPRPPRPRPRRASTMACFTSRPYVASSAFFSRRR